MNIRSWFVAGCAVGLLATTASAEWERTVSAFDTQTPDEGKLQVALWGGYWEYEFARVDGDDMNAALYVNYGILDNWSVSLVPTYYDWDIEGLGSESGISDTRILTTYRFTEETDSAPAFAVMGSLSLPTGDDDDGLGTGSVEPGVMLLCSKDLGALTLVGNVGVDFIADADRGEEDFILSAELEGIVPVSEQVSVNAVLAAETARWDEDDDTVDLGLGLRVEPNEQTFVVGAVYGCLTDAYDWGLQLAGGYQF